MSTAAAGPLAGQPTTPEKFIYVSDKPEELEKYVDVSNNGWDGKKWKFKVSTKRDFLDKLPHTLKKLLEDTNSLNLGTIKTNGVDINFNLETYAGLPKQGNGKLDNITYKKVDFPLVDTTKLITDLSTSFTSKTTEIQETINRLSTKYNTFRTQLTNLGITGQITLNMAFLNKYNDPDKWQKITNKDKPGTYGKDTINPTNIDIINGTINNAVKPSKINEYFQKCEELQVFYNQKHNEIISFNNYLRNLIKLNMDILKIITDLLHLVRRKTKGSKSIKADIKVVKNLIDNIQDFADKQNTTYDGIKTAFTDTGVDLNKVLAGGGGPTATGAAAATGLSTRRILPSIPRTTTTPVQIHITSDESNPANLKLTNFTKDGSIKNGQYILILGELNATGTANPGIFAKKTNTNTYEIVKTLPNGSDANNIIANFNAKSRDVQDKLIDVLEYYVDDDETMALIIQLRGIQIARYFSFQNIYSNMQEKELLKDEGDLSQIVSKQKYDIVKPNLQKRKLEYTKENEEEIQTVLYHCYDLQVLYLLKHSEFVNLFKVILYFLDVFVQLMMLFEFILTLFGIFTIDIDDKPEEIIFPEDFIPNVQKVIRAQQEEIFGGIAQAGGSAPPATGVATAATTTFTVPGNDAEFITKLHELSGIDKATLEGNKSSIPRLINLIEEQMYTININESEKYKKLNKALLLAKYWLVKDIDSSKVSDDAKEKLKKMYESDKPSTIASEIDHLSFIEGKATKDIRETMTKLEEDRRKMIKDLTPKEIKEEKIGELSQKFAEALVKLQEAEGKSTCTTREECLNAEVVGYIGVIASYLNVEITEFDSVKNLEHHDDLKILAEYIKEQYTLKKQIPRINKLITVKIGNLITQTSNVDIQIILMKIKQIKETHLETLKQKFQHTAKMVKVVKGIKSTLAESQRQKQETEYNTLYTKYETEFTALQTKLGTVLQREYNSALTKENVETLTNIKNLVKYTKPASISNYPSEQVNLQQQVEKLNDYNIKLNKITTILDSNKPKTIKLLKEQTSFSDLDVVMAIMNAFNGKSDHQKTAINELLKTEDLKEAQTNFTNITKVYKLLSVELLAIIDNDDTVITDNFEKYKTSIESAKQEYNNKFTKGIDNIALANLYEIIGGAARTIVRIKPERDTDNSAPVIKKQDMAGYTIKQYLQEKKLMTQNGGYDYSNIINVQKNNSIKIGNFCDGILPETSNAEYGPFSAIYPPQYNNFDIYANMFGADSITELRNANPTITNFSLDKLALNGIRTFKPITNQLQNLMKKLSDNGSVVIFGYGFSGSGKTYSLIEGSRKDCYYANCDKVMGGGARQSARPSPAKAPAPSPAKVAASPPAPVPVVPSQPSNFVKYDPSLLEQFIKNNADTILSVEFKEIYPLGIVGNPNIKVIQESPIPEESKDFTTAELIDEPTYTAYQKEIDKNNLLGDEKLHSDGKTQAQAKAQDDGQYDLFNKIDLQAGVEATNKYYLISNRIRMLERHRIHKLRILATPNNDNSSRSFLQITLNIKPKDDSDENAKPQLVFFDMPGTENTVRIKTEFMGADIFSDIENQSKVTIPNRNTFDKISSQQANQYIGEINTVNKYKDDIQQYIEVIYTGTKIFSVKKIKQIPDNIKLVGRYTETEKQDAPNNIKKAIENILFKYVFMQMLTFKTYCGITVKNDAVIGDIGFELLTFFNKLDVNNFNELPINRNFFFLTDKIYQDIFDKFMIFFTAKVGNDNKFFSNTPNKYCKIAANIDITDNTKLTVNELKEFIDIFDINPIRGVERPNVNSFFNVSKKTNSKIDVENTTFKKIFGNPLRGEHINFYVANPLFKYLLIAFFNIYKNINSTIATSNTSGLDKQPILIRASVFFIYKFINFIVNQGRGIVTNLEHLKFFFLSRTGQINSYNTANPSKKFEFDNDKQVLKQPKIYTVDTDIIDNNKQTIKLQERVNMGEMETYRLLSVLQDLAQSNPTLSALWDENKKYLDIMKSTDGNTSALGAIFVMFTNIKVFLDKETDYITSKDNEKLKPELNKLCTAEFDTLEFAESISSATRSKPPPKPIVPVAPLEGRQKTIAEFIEKAANPANPANSVNNNSRLFNGGGSIKHYRKFNLNELKPKHNIYRRTKKVKSIKRNNNQRPQRTKKNN
jgi:hypothetical protein